MKIFQRFFKEEEEVLLIRVLGSPWRRQLAEARVILNLLYTLQSARFYTVGTSEKKPDFPIDSKAASANARPSRPFVL